MNNRKVDYKDRVKSIDYLRIALNMVDISIDYQATYLITMVISELSIMDEGKFSLNDAIELRQKFDRKFDEYFKNKDQENEHNKRD